MNEGNKRDEMTMEKNVEISHIRNRNPKKQRRNCANICRWERRTNIEKVSKYSFNFSSKSSLAFFPLGNSGEFFEQIYVERWECSGSSSTLKWIYALLGALMQWFWQFSSVFITSDTAAELFWLQKFSSCFLSTFYSPRDRPKANCSNARNAQNFAISQLTSTAVSKRERKVMVNLTHELKFTKWKMWAKVALDNKWEKKLSDEPQTHHETAVDKSFIRAHFTESRARDKMRPLTRGRHDQSIASWRSL